MDDDATIFLHIGLPKTGTTYLQKQIFPELHSIDYLHKPLGNFLQDGSDPMYGVMDRAFKHAAVIWRELGDEIFRRLTGESKGTRLGQRSLLISDEGIGAGGDRPTFLRTHLEEFAKKSHDWGFSSLKIICIVRRQDQWLGSHYAQLSDRNPDASQHDFETFVDALIDKKKRFYAEGIMLDYKTLRDQLVLGTSPDHVLMLPYELLKADPDTYLSRILDFLGARETSGARNDSVVDGGSALHTATYNARSVSKDVWALRDRTFKDAETIRLRLGRLFNTLGLSTDIPLRVPAFGRAQSIRLTEELKEKVLSVYAQSNRALAADLCMDLSQYGYY